MSLANVRLRGGRGEAAHDFVKPPLPFGIGPSHICRKPAETSATPPRALIKVNAGGWKPNEDANNRAFEAGWQAEGIIDEY
jgi:hypothetical protein